MMKNENIKKKSKLVGNFFLTEYFIVVGFAVFNVTFNLVTRFALP